LWSTGILALSVIFFAGCEMDDETEFDKQLNQDADEIRTYLEKNNIEAENPSEGFYYVTLESFPENREIESGEVAAVYYTLEQLDGTVIKEYMDEERDPVIFKHYSGALLPEGIDYGMQFMRIGETMRFYIPSYLAYNYYGNNEYFPAYTNMIATVKLVDIYRESDLWEEETARINQYIEDSSLVTDEYASGLHFIELEPGDGASPVIGSTIEFHFTRKYLDGTVIYSTPDDDPVRIQLGSGQTVQGLREGLQLMRAGGKATLIMPSKIAFKSSLQVIPNELREDLYDNKLINTLVEPYQPLIYDIELLEAN
jgi:FKBP-type peptidyl-prolyl cis-trans isomerase